MDPDTLISLSIALLCISVTLFREKKYRETRAQFLEVLGDIADSTAYIYDRAKADQLCNAETAKTVAGKAGEIWKDLQVLGPAVVTLLGEKSSLAEALKN